MPAKETGHTYCMVMVDKFSKYTLLEGVPETITSEQLAKIFIRRVIAEHGVPSMVVSDRGPQFVAKMWDAVLRIMGAKASLTTAHHLQSDGQSERMIQSLLCLIRTYTEENPSDWEEALPLLQYAINDAYCNSTHTTYF